MDFGLSGKKAVVCATSKGLGRAVAVALACEGADLVIIARSQDTLEAAAEHIHAKTHARSSIPAGRFGRPEGFDAFVAFLCRANAGYLTGHDIVLDGGAYPGLT